MKREIQKRKKGFWALCLAILLAWMQLAPQVVYAAEYDLTGENYEVVSPGTDYLMPGDVLKYTCTDPYGDNRDYNADVEYYDKDGTTKIETLCETSKVTGAGSQRITVRSYPFDTGLQITDEDAFRGWAVLQTWGSGGSLSYVRLKAVEYEKFNIIYVDDGAASSGENPPSYYAGKEDIALEDVSKEGYEFAGWYTESAFTESSRVTAITKAMTGNITLYARFLKISNITYMLNGGTIADGANPSTYTEGIGVGSLAAPEKTGYTFDGWYSDAECTTKVTSISATETGDITLYAKFTGKSYNITYNLGEGVTNNPSNPQKYTCGVGVWSFYDAVKPGHDFQYWCVEKGDALEQISSIPVDYYGDVTLKPSFTPATYTINYELDSGTNGAGNPGEYTYGTGVPNLADASKEGYTFDGWYSENTFTNKVSSIAANETGDKTLWARFLKNYTITYELNGGTVVAGPNPNYYVAGRGITSFAPATKTGYTFGGWYSDAACTAGNEVTEISATKTGEMILYAKFIVNDFQITYELDGGMNGAGNPTGYVYGLGVSSLADASKEGYTFDGWFTDASFTVPVTSISASRTGDVKLYAKFTKIVILSDGKGSITVSDTNYGETINPICVSETNGTENVSVTYKMKGADDATYTETVPVKPGDYTARAIFAKTDAYKQVTATCDFSIAYLTTPANPYAISGTKGKNNYYTTNVTITPAAGYLIADALDGTYQEKLEFSKTTDAFSVYLKKTDTGAKTAGIKVAEIKIDKSAPVISGAKNGQTIYGDEGKIVVKDANLSRVTVNGKKILIAEKSLEIPLSSQRGEEKYVIIAHDLAGNKKKLTVTVAAEWTKKKSIPSGEKVKLYKNRSYSFGTKTFKVSNDDTTYAANTTFYVGSDGDYVFSETN